MNNITKAELQTKITNKEDFVLVDVREPQEHADFNLGGILLPLGQIQNMDIAPIQEFKDKEIIVYCRSGRRSVAASLILEQLGFLKVTNLLGGVLEWQ